jgi:hypothetical protein
MVCDKNMTYEECELAILRSAVDRVGKQEGAKLLNDPEIKKIVEIVENFLRKKKLVCYGGTAINALLPPSDQFYDVSVELPDYDFYSPTPLKDAHELADIYYKQGFKNIEAKAGVHVGTYKVFVNFIPVADITEVVPGLYKTIKKNAITVDGIYYSSPDYLRMLMYLELSRPMGDTSRWEKVLKRISLLNKNYPLKGVNCDNIEIQRLFETKSQKNLGKDKMKKLFNITRDVLINQGVVFFGAMALKLYLRKFGNHKLATIPDFDVLSMDPLKTAEILKNELVRNGYNKVTITRKDGVGEIIAPHYEVVLDKETLVIIYEPNACHSYNKIRIQKKDFKIATIDTILSFYLAFIHADRKYYDVNRLLCLAQHLFTMQQRNRLKQHGLLKRFSINCYGKQDTLDTMRAEKAEMFEKLKGKRGGPEWDRYFLKYIPGADTNATKVTKTKVAKVTTTDTKRKPNKTNKTRKTMKMKKTTKKKRRKKRKKTVKITNVLHKLFWD